MAVAVGKETRDKPATNLELLDLRLMAGAFDISHRRGSSTAMLEYEDGSSVDKAALDKQAQERHFREAQESAELRAFAQKAAQMDSLLCSAQHTHMQQRRALNKGVDAHRNHQAAEKHEREVREHQREQMENAAEQQAAVNSPWLTEDPRVEVSALSPYRVRRDHWKGMSAGQLEGIRNTQAQQMAAKAQEQQHELHEKQAYDRMQLSFADTMNRNAAQAEAARKQEARRLAAELQRQVVEQQQRDAALDRLYTNPPKDTYFGQWGTSHR
ncbi:hypothetical protein N2152v2_003916 [Parachlorella kessleri]